MRLGRNEQVDKAILALEIRGRWAIAFEMAPEAQRRLCEEIARIIPSIMRSLKNYADYGASYTAAVYPVEVRR